MFSILVLCLFGSMSFAANLCNEGRLPNFSYPVRQAPVVLFGLHAEATVNNSLDYQGPGYCYKAPKAEGVSMAASYEYAGLFRGLAEATYLYKVGGKHVLVRRGWIPYVGDAVCPNLLADDLTQAKKLMSQPTTEVSEARLIPGGLGFSVYVPNDLNYEICYFPIR
jgi:hypothetical protein